MKSWNGRFFLPSVLLGCVLISTAVLAQSKQTGVSVEENEGVVVAEVLPVTTDRISLTQVASSEPTYTSTNEGESANSEAVGQPQITSAIVTPLQTQANPSPIVSSPNQTDEGVTQEAEPTKPEAEQASQIQVKLVIQGPGISKSGKISVQAGSTVYQVMKQGSQELDFSLKTSHHSSLGIFVEGIAGVTNNPKTNLYWLYYLNGQFASRGVSLQTVQEGDTITWSYE